MKDRNFAQKKWSAIVFQTQATPQAKIQTYFSVIS